MRRIQTLTALLLITTAFVLAAPASADDVEECTAIEDANVCVYDTTKGDADQACDEEGSGSYEGSTGADASTGEEAPYAQASAEGQETCEHTSWSYNEDEQISADATVCLEASGFWCTTGAETSVTWDEEGIHAIYLDGVEVDTPAGSADVGAQWAESWNGDTVDADIDVCLAATGFCEPSAYAAAGWEEGGLEGESVVCLEQGFLFCANGAGVYAFWGEDWTGECYTEASAFASLYGEERVEEGCPAGAPPAPPAAPGAPNPGWGQLTPDTGE